LICAVASTPTCSATPAATLTRSFAEDVSVADELVNVRRLSVPKATTTLVPGGLLAVAGAVIVRVEVAVRNPLATTGDAGSTPETATIRPAGWSAETFHVYELGSDAPATL
jgi:hypothetical protein